VTELNEARRENPRIFVLAPAHNRVNVTLQFAQCLVAQRWRNFRLVLIDDGSTDGTAQRVQALVADATVLRGNGNLWWAGSLQKGYEWLCSSPSVKLDDLVLLINDDTVFDPDFLEKAVAAMGGKQRTLMLAAQYSLQTRKHLESGVHVDWHKLSFAVAASPEEVNCLSTRGLFMRVRDMLEIGGFHTWLLPHYGSDYEYTMRAHRKGFALVSSPEVRLWDNEATTGIRSAEGQSGWTLLRRMFLKRNLQSPYFWSMFVLLACPPRYWFRNLARVWKGFCRQLMAAPWAPGSIEQKR
jgi:GT2 family glycosyltransferase